MKGYDKLVKLLEVDNIAEKLDEDVLRDIGEKVCRGYDIDVTSRHDWLKMAEDSMKFAKQITELKTFPFPEGSSNVIFPLVTMAANTFASRLYPEIIKNNKCVNFTVIGEDPDGQKNQKAMRLANHMNYQRLVESETWEADKDKMLHVLPIVGTCFMKAFYDPCRQTSEAELCAPADVVVNHFVSSLAKAPRITHRFKLYENELIERIRGGQYLKVELASLDPAADDKALITVSKDDMNAEDNDLDKRHEILEQHTFLDLDDDDYAEPYIVLVHRPTEKVLAIYRRFDLLPDVQLNDEGEIKYIIPTQYFIDYHFLRPSDGTFHGVGYGHILFPINKAINSLINQLIDAGTLANLQSGFMKRGLKLGKGEVRLKMGEIQPLDGIMEGPIQDAIMPMPFKEPSPVLLQLLQLMLDAGREIASINDVLLGQAQTQNSPATSMLSQENNGLKVFNAISKRYWVSLKKEFNILFKLNQRYFSVADYSAGSVMVEPDDYNAQDLTVIPVASPDMGSDAIKLAQTRMLAEFANSPVLGPAINPQGLIKRIFEAMRFSDDDMKELIAQPAPPPPDPKVEIEKMKLQMQDQWEQASMKIEEMKAQSDMAAKMIKFQESKDKREKMDADTELKMSQMQQNLEQIKQAQEALKQGWRELELKAAKIASDHEIGMTAASKPAGGSE